MLIRTLASVSLVLGLALAAGEGEKKAENSGNSCPHLAPESCDTINIYTDAELKDPEFLKARDLDPRQIDLSSLDDDTVNVTQLLRRDDLGHLQGPDLHSRVEELLSHLGKRDLFDAYQLLTRATEDLPDGTYAVCKDTPKEKKGQHARKGIRMLYKTSPYPAGIDLYDCTDWNNCMNFKFQKGGQESPRRKYANEHVLERQMLQQFFHAQIEDKPLAVPIDGYKDFCHMMREYWYADDAKEQTEKPQTLVNGLQAWDFVGAAWPNKQQAAEMPRLESNINGMKARAFKSGTAIKDMENTRAWFNGDRKLHHTEARKDLLELKESVRIGLFLTAYMNHPDIQKIYKDQAERVALALGQAEDALVQNWSNHATRPPYKKQNLDTKFRAWIKEYTGTVSGKLEDHINLCEGFLDQQIEKSKDRKIELYDHEKRLVKEMEATVKESRKMKEGFKNPF